MNVLIVDDDTALLDTIVDTVRSWGHRADGAATGQDALQKVENRYFDLIVCDVFLPDVRGHLLISKIKKRWPESRFISMTGYNTRDLEKEVRREGVMFHMIKPFDMKQLCSIINHMSKKKLPDIQ